MDRKRLKSYEKGLEIINIHVFKMPGLDRYRRIFFFFPANHNYKLWTKEKGKGKLLKVAKDAKLVRNLGTGHPSSCHPLHRRKPNPQTSLSPVPHLATEGRETRLYMAGRSFQPKALLPTQGYWEAWWKTRKGSSHSEWPCPRSSFVLSAQESPGLPRKA